MMAGPTAIFSYLFVRLFVVNFISFTYLIFMDILFTSIILTLISIVVVFYIIIPQKSLETAITFSSIVAIYNLLYVDKSDISRH